MFVVGAVDDVINLRAKLKLIGQVIAACLSGKLQVFCSAIFKTRLSKARSSIRNPLLSDHCVLSCRIREHHQPHRRTRWPRFGHQRDFRRHHLHVLRVRGALKPRSSASSSWVYA